MAKISEKQLKRDKIKIIDQLKKNADKSINDIAKTCGFSRQKVWRIVKDLEKEKTIWGYTSIVDEAKKGMGYYILLLKRNTIPIKSDVIKTISSREIEKHIEKLGCEFVSSLYTHGFYDWVIIFTAPDKIQAKKVNEIFIDRYHDYLVEIKLLETIFPVKIQGFVNPNIKNLHDLF